MRIALVTGFDKTYGEMGLLTSSQKWGYCQKHGYDPLVRFFYDYSDRAISWNKIKSLYDVLGQYDWLFWCDCDTVINDEGYKLEKLIDEKYNLVIGADHYGLNAGCFLLRGKGQWTVDFLDAVWNFDGPDWLWGSPWEQMAIQELVKGDKLVKVIPNPTFNSYDQAYYEHGKHKAGDFILHYPGIHPYEKRLKIIKDRLYSK